jgi:amino acid transporter
MLIVAVFYITTNFVILGTVDQTTLASSQSPLMDATEMMFSDLGGLATLMPIIIGVGALLSILGADESGTIGTSRLAYAMSLDGLLPRSMSTLHSKYNTPYIGLAVICITAFVASIIGGLAALISASVFLLAFAYLATCASAISLQRKAEDSAIKSGTRLVLPILGIGFSATLLFLVGPKNIVVSAAMLLVGVPIYVAFTPRRELSDLKASFLSREAVLRRAYEQGEQFLAYPWRRLAWIYYRFRGRAKPWVVSRKTKAPPNA